jgi:hypothetical protein
MLSELEMEFAQIKRRWKTHSELFDNDENVGLLNRCGGQVFALFQKLLIYDTLASLCRLCDPAKSMGKKGNENNSIYNQYEKQKVNLNSTDIKDIDSLLSSLKSKMKNIKTLRDKAISHNDLSVAENAMKLPDVTFGEIDELIDLITKLLNKIFSVRGNYSSVKAFGPGTQKLFKILCAGEKVINS